MRKYFVCVCTRSNVWRRTSYFISFFFSIFFFLMHRRSLRCRLLELRVHIIPSTRQAPPLQPPTMSLTLPSGVVDALGIIGGGPGFSSTAAYNNHSHRRVTCLVHSTRIIRLYRVCTR